MAYGHDARIMFEIMSPAFRIRHPASLGATQFDHCQSVSPQQTPQRLRRGENGPLGISRSQQLNEILHKRKRAPGAWRGQMGDLDDLIAVNRAPEMVLQEPLHGHGRGSTPKRTPRCRSGYRQRTRHSRIGSTPRRLSAQTKIGRPRSASSRAFGLRLRRPNASDRIAAPQRTSDYPHPVPHRRVE